MNFTFFYQKMDGSDSLESYATKKIGRSLIHFFPMPDQVQVSFSIDSNNLSSCSVELNGIGGHLIVEDQGSYIYDCVDRVAIKLERILKDKKERGKIDRAVKSWIDEIDLIGLPKTIQS